MFSKQSAAALALGLSQVSGQRTYTLPVTTYNGLYTSELFVGSTYSKAILAWRVNTKFSIVTAWECPSSECTGPNDFQVGQSNTATRTSNGNSRTFGAYPPLDTWTVTTDTVNDRFTIEQEPGVIATSSNDLKFYVAISATNWPSTEIDGIFSPQGFS